MKAIVVGLLLWAAFLVSCSEGILLGVRGGETKCLKDEFRKGALVSGHFEVSDRLNDIASNARRGPPVAGSLRYRSPALLQETSQYLQLRFVIFDAGNEALFTKEDPKQGSFAFTTHEDGMYSFCFTNNIKPGWEMAHFQQPEENAAPSVMTLKEIHKTVSLKVWIGPEAKDFSEIAKLENLKPLELELLRIEDASSRMKDAFGNQREGAENINLLNEGVSSKFGWLSIVSFFTLFGSVVWQLWFLKKFLKQKKVID